MTDASGAADEVLYEVADHVATITLNAPERMNTLSPELGRLLAGYWCRPTPIARSAR